VSAVSSSGLGEFARALFEVLGLVRFYSKPPGKKPDLEVPYLLRRGSTVEDAAAHVHRDFAEHLKYARLFRMSEEHDGLMVERSHVVEDGDILEFHAQHGGAIGAVAAQVASHGSAAILSRDGSRLHPTSDLCSTPINSLPLRALHLSAGAVTRGEGIVSRWTETDDKVEIAVSAEGLEPHDAALELLVCLGQALWEGATPAEYTAWLELLRAEVEAGVRGEIDDHALRSKRELLSSRTAARSTRRLHTYAAASFGSTAAEYIHGLWHDVTVRAGPEHLPAAWLRKRIEFMVKFFPPDPGQRVIAQEQAPV
jgi:hypothetical protein